MKQKSEINSPIHTNLFKGKTMKKFSVISLLVLLVVLASVSVVFASSQHYEAHLTSTGEPFPVDSQAVGQAIFRVTNDGQAIEYRLIVANIEDARMAHIHYLPSGAATGPISVWLYPETPQPILIPGVFNGVLMSGTITQADLDALIPATGADTRPIKTMAELLAAMEAGSTYVNVHTVVYGAGEIRGPIK